ncbi:Alanine racemase [Bienertia sinuspersici]
MLSSFMSSLFKIHNKLDFVCTCVYVDMDTSWIDLRNDDPAFYEGCKAFVEIAKETSIEGNTRCPCNKCKLNKWFPLEEGQDKEKDKEKEADLDDMGDELKPALDEFISQKWKENQFEQSRVLENIENEWTINEYADWLRSQAHNLDDNTVEGKLRKALAGGLSSQAMAMKSVFINGYKFDIVDLGELDWHHIDDVLLADMINEIRDRFVIPDGEIYINKILSRIAKVWRQYKSHLKSLYFKPQEKSQEEHYTSIPCGISRDNWRKLVKYWFSEKGQVMQYMSECGKEARASQCHIHISGGKSFANIRADYEDKHGEEMSLVELYEDVHMRKDGSFIEGTQAQDFLEDAKAKTDILAETDGSKSRKEVENEVFESLMYGGEPPKRPRGFGFGVVKSNIYGVHGLLRKEGRGKVHKRPLDNENVKLTMSENAELVKRNEVLEERLNQNTMLLMSLLEGMRNGKPSTELIDAAQTSLRIANPKVTTSHCKCI